MLGFHMGSVPAPFKRAEHDTEYWLQQINRASVVANTESGLLDAGLARQIRSALDALLEEAGKPGADRCDLYIQFEPKLLKRCGVGASVLHAGRSSQDILATANAAMNREHLMMLAEAVADLCAALIEAARRESDAVVPAYTNGVQAQPTLYSHYLLAQCRVFCRDITRLMECCRRYDVCPMGSCVCNGTGWPLNSSRMAELLGFSRAADNAFDAGQCQGNDLPLESSQIIASVMIHINAFLADFMQQYSQAQPWIYSVSQNGVYRSSAMPQKRNPGLINDCRRDAGLVLGETDGIRLRLQNLTLGMADARDAWIMRDLFADACTVVRTFTGIVSSLRVDRERALAELNADWTCTQEIADTLMREAGVDFRTGHRFASHFVTWARENGRTPADTPFSAYCSIWEKFASENGLTAEFPLSEDHLKKATEPLAILQNRKTAGSASPLMLDQQIRSAEDLLSRERDWIEIYFADQEAASQALSQAIDAI
ncbi:MAG: lyase family protein [Sutterella sp.]|nr:lyase family protein [Sutterella sp.]